MTGFLPIHCDSATESPVRLSRVTAGGVSPTGIPMTSCPRAVIGTSARSRTHAVVRSFTSSHAFHLPFLPRLDEVVFSHEQENHARRLFDPHHPSTWLGKDRKRTREDA